MYYQKENVIARLGFELADYDVTVQRVCHYTIEIPQFCLRFLSKTLTYIFLNYKLDLSIIWEEK